MNVWEQIWDEDYEPREPADESRYFRCRGTDRPCTARDWVCKHSTPQTSCECGCSASDACPECPKEEEREGDEDFEDDSKDCDYSEDDKCPLCCSYGEYQPGCEDCECCPHAEECGND